MKKVRFLFFYLGRFLLRYQQVIWGVILILLVVGLVFNKTHVSFFKKTITEGVVGTYTQQDLPPLVTHLMSQSLVILDNSGKAQPNLAQSWQVSDDGTTYTFKLKPNLKWADGLLVKSSDIALSLEGANISFPSDRDIQIKLSDPYSFLPELLDKPIFKKQTTFLGTGPYRISGINKDTRSDVFLTKISLTTDEVNLPNIQINFYSNEDIARSAFKLGKVQSILGVQDQEKLFLQHPFAVVTRGNHTKMVAIFYNNKDDQLADKNLRIALSSVTPAVKGEEQANGPYPSSSWVFNPQVRDYLDNPTQAKSFFDKVSKKGKVVLTATTNLVQVGTEVVESWKRLGLEAELRIESGIPQNFQALLITQDTPLYPDQYLLWHSTQSQTNLTKYSSPRVDKDLEDGRKVVNANDKKNKYLDFQKVLLDDAPATFLYFPKYNVIYQKKVASDLQKILQLQLPDLFK